MTKLVIPAAALAPAPDCCGSIVPAPSAPDATVIVNDGWFPDVDLDHFRKQMRVRDAITVDRQREAALGAIITVANDLDAWATDRRAAGAVALATVADWPNPPLDGLPRLVILYRRAVYAYAKADLVERNRDVDLTGAGQRRAEDLEPTVGELRRDGLHAIRDILRRSRTTVELI